MAHRIALTTVAIAVVVTVLGCGAATKHTTATQTTAFTSHCNNCGVSGAITVSGAATTISNVETGTRIRCKGGSGAKVPRRGVGVSESSGVDSVGSATTAPPPTEISVMHLPNGSITVSCKSSS